MNFVKNLECILFGYIKDRKQILKIKFINIETKRGICFSEESPYIEMKTRVYLILTSDSRSYLSEIQ